MAKLSEIKQFLDEELKINEIKDVSSNGLQVENEKEIKKIGFAVDACMETFQKAKKAGCDLLIVHHGIIWHSLKTITGIEYRQIKYLFENNMALYAAHLPLDMHREYGNNVQLAKLLGVKVTKDFFEYDGVKVGVIGETNSTLEEMQNKLKKNNMPALTLPFGNKQIKTVAICSGGGSAGIREAISEKADLLVVGEAVHYVYHYAKEGKINVIFNGHYESEVWGVKALMKPIKEKFKTDVEFIDVPTTI